MKNFNIGRGKGKEAATPKKGAQPAQPVPPSPGPSVQTPLDTPAAEKKKGLLKGRAPKQPREKKPRAPKPAKMKKEREPRPVADKGGKKRSPAMPAGIAALVIIAVVLAVTMMGGKDKEPQVATQDIASEARKARMEMKKKQEAGKTHLLAEKPPVPELTRKGTPAPEPASKPKPAPEAVAKPRPAPAPAMKEKKIEKPVRATVVAKKQPTEKRESVERVAATPAPARTPITYTKRTRKTYAKPKAFVRPEKLVLKADDYFDLKPFVPVAAPAEPDYYTPEPGSPVDEEMRRQTVFYMVLVEESESRDELREVARNLNLITVDPEIREKWYGERRVYWLTAGHYTREADAYNMAQVIRRTGYIAEVVSEKIYH